MGTRIRWIGFCLIFLAVLGCENINPVSLKELTFNERILEYHKAITPNQTDTDYATSKYRSGSPHRFVDELLPVLPGVPNSVLEQLWHSDCFWIERPGYDMDHNFKATWEVVAKITDTPQELFKPGNNLIGLCTGGHPTSRVPLKDPDGDPVNMRFINSLSHSARLDVSMQRVLTQPWNDPPSECTIPEMSGGLVIDSFPLGCRSNVPLRINRDQTIKLLASAAGVLGERYLKPTIKMVGWQRIMERQMEAQRPAEEDGVLRYKYTWSTVRTDGSWEDNFSPRLYVSQVRFYKKLSNGHKRYVSPFRFKLRKLDMPVMSCYPDPFGNPAGSDFFLAERCDPALPVTPTYVHEYYSDPIEWEVAFNSNPLLDDTNKPDSRELYIEFTLRPHFGDKAASVTPYLNFNYVALSQTSTQTARIENVGVLPVQIERVEIQGADPTDFTFRYAPPLNLTTPFTLAAGHSLPIEITAAPTTEGQKTAELKVVTPDHNIITQLLMTGARDAFIDVYPAAIDLHSDNTPWRAVGIDNFSMFPATVTWTLTGPDPQYFRVLSERPTRNNPRPPPMPAQFTLQPGRGETLYVFYNHTGLNRVGPDALTDRAQLEFNVQGSMNQHVVDLTGTFVPFPTPPRPR